LIAFFAILVLSGCSITVTTPDCCQSPIMTEYNVTVISTSENVYGEILMNGKETGKHFLPKQSYQSIMISGVPRNEVVVISIRDCCGYLSHEESVYTSEINNYVTFRYWGPCGVRGKNLKEQGKKDCQDCHLRPRS